MAYNGATICLNGHVISKYAPNHQKRCTECGEMTFSQCGHCGAPIRGLAEITGVVVLGNRPYKRPGYCYECGEPYPWTEKILNSAVELLSLDDELDIETKTLIKNSIPDLLIDVPTTLVAVAKYNKGMSKASEIIKNAMYNLLIDVVSETAKKSLLG